MPLPSMNSAEWTYPPRDWVPVDYSGGDVDLQDALGSTPRALRADTGGKLVFRCAETPSGTNRTMNLTAGEVLIGFFTEIIQAGSTATVHVAK